MTDGEAVGLWNLATGQLLHELGGFKEVSAIALDASGGVLAVGYGAGHAALVDVKGGKVTQEFKVAQLPDILAIGVCDGGARVIVSSTANLVAVCDSSGKLLHSYRHPGQIDAVALNRKGSLCASVSGGEEGDRR
jgi:WD40 repeat protein